MSVSEVFNPIHRERGAGASSPEDPRISPSGDPDHVEMRKSRADRVAKAAISPECNKVKEEVLVKLREASRLLHVHAIDRQHVGRKVYATGLMAFGRHPMQAARRDLGSILLEVRGLITDEMERGSAAVEVLKSVEERLEKTIEDLRSATALNRGRRLAAVAAVLTIIAIVVTL